jgi:hypothetical protein
MMARPRRPLTSVEKAFPCPRCGAGLGERCRNPGGTFYNKFTHADRGRGAGTGAEYTVTCCRNCRHPGGQHVLDDGCRLCRDCPGWKEGGRLAWSDRKTDDLLAAMEGQGSE